MITENEFNMYSDTLTCHNDTVDYIEFYLKPLVIVGLLTIEDFFNLVVSQIGE